MQGWTNTSLRDCQCIYLFSCLLCADFGGSLSPLLISLIQSYVRKALLMMAQEPFLAKV